MIVSDKITDENMEQIELEIATKVVLFERKLSKLESTKLSKQVNISTNGEKVKLQVKHTNSSLTSPMFNFDLEVRSNLTIGGLAKAIGEV